MNKLKWLLKVSRPRFWPYLFGPFLIGFVSTGHATEIPYRLALLLMLIYFTFPANLLIYGINDVYDYETDKRNPKKQHYEALVTPKQHNYLAAAIAVTNFPFILTFLFWNGLPVAPRIAMALFLFFGVGYSAPPIRAKVHPLVDTVFNSLYVFPSLVSYGLITGSWPSLQLFIAAVLWCMAMHAFSAIPDIKSDRKAKINTVATLLGPAGTMLFCGICYALAAVLSFATLRWFAVVIGAVYVGVMLAAWFLATSENIFRLYKSFPKLNLLVGFSLFWWVYIVVK